MYAANRRDVRRSRASYVFGVIGTVRRKILLPFLLLLLAGCGPNTEVAEREEYWKAEAASFFEVERELSELHSWLREHEVYYTFEESEIIDGNWTKGLEKIYDDSSICDPWTILLTVSLVDSGEILEYSISRLGTCW